MQKSVTIKSIASELGISLSAVSKAINDYPDISVETKKMVLAKALEMGYSSFAFNKATSETSILNALGIVVNDLSAVYGELFRSLSSAAKKRNLNLIISDSNNSVEDENKFLQSLTDSHVAGIIIAPVNDDYERIMNIVSDKVPIVFIGNSITNPECNYIATDSKNGTTVAMEYLYKLGHRNIALVGDSKPSKATQTKIDTYKDFMLSHNLIPAVFTDTSPENTSTEAGYVMTNRILSVNRGFTAVYAIRDNVAIGVMKALKEAGKRIPEDISVIGYDDSSISSNPLVELTSVAWNMEEIPEKLVEIIVSQSDKNTGKAPEHHIAKPYVVERKSCISLHS